MITTTYLLTGFFEHDNVELQKRGDAIYKRNLHMSKYHTHLVGELKNNINDTLTGLISSHLSDSVSHKKALGAVTIGATQRLPLIFGTSAIKNHTTIYLIHELEDGKYQFLRADKKTIHSSLAGKYYGFCQNLSLNTFNNLIDLYKLDSALLENACTEIMNSKEFKSTKKRHAEFTLDILAENRNGGGFGNNSPEPVPCVPEFVINNL
jgi:hypothetical protein